MKSVLVAIAKNEDNYLKEWVDYHLKLGFDKIVIYQNNWRYTRNDLIGNVQLIEFDGQRMQPKAYQHFIDQNYNNFDFGCFWDIDEFFCSNVGWNINNVLERYTNTPVIGVPRCQFGDSGLKHVINKEYSVVKRFTHSQNGYETLIKPIINFNIVKNDIAIPNPHIATNRKYIPYTAIDPCGLTDGTKDGNHWTINNLNFPQPFYLNHYVLKTIEERIERRHSGDAYWGDEWRNRETDDDIKKFFEERNSCCNCNENLLAKKFMYGDNI